MKHIQPKWIELKRNTERNNLKLQHTGSKWIFLYYFKLRELRILYNYKVCKGCFSTLKVNLLNALLMILPNGPNFDETNSVIQEPTDTKCP